MVNLSTLGTLYTPKVNEAQFKSWMSSVEERLRTMETQQRLFNASIKGGAIVVFNDSEQRVATLGRVAYTTNSGPVETDALSVTNSVGGFHLVVDTVRGIVGPQFSINAWNKEDNPADIYISGSTSDASAWKCTFTLTTNVLIGTIAAQTDPSTVAETWLEIDGTYATNHWVINPIGFTTHTFKWDLSSFNLGFGTVHTMRVMTKVTSGVGANYIYAPDTFYSAILEDYPTADSGGDV